MIASDPIRCSDGSDPWPGCPDKVRAIAELLVKDLQVKSNAMKRKYELAEERQRPASPLSPPASPLSPPASPLPPPAAPLPPPASPLPPPASPLPPPASPLPPQVWDYGEGCCDVATKHSGINVFEYLLDLKF